MSFYDKYMKYKKKYLELVGGSQNSNIMNQKIYTLKKTNPNDVSNLIRSIGQGLYQLIPGLKLSGMTIMSYSKRDTSLKNSNIFSFIYSKDQENSKETDAKKFLESDSDSGLIRQVYNYITSDGDNYKVSIQLNKQGTYNNYLYMSINIEGNKIEGTITIIDNNCQKKYDEAKVDNLVELINYTKANNETNGPCLTTFYIILTLILNIKGQFNM